MKTKTSAPLPDSRPFRKILALISLGLSATCFGAQAGQGPQPGICSRACWGARAPACGISQMSSLTRATIHHTAGVGDYSTSLENSKVRVRGVQNLHINNGWCDIGYHFIVDAAGNIFEGRAGALSSLPRGAHDACNNNSFGFTALGYFHPPYNQAFTTAMRNAMEAAIAWRMPSAWSPYGSGTYCGDSVGFLDGHYKVVPTACPGDIIIAQLQGMRDGVNSRKNPPPAHDRHVVGDWNANGSSGPGAVRKEGSNLAWYLKNNNTGGAADIIFNYGEATDKPIAGDWDGNGSVTVGVVRKEGGNWTWLLRNSLSAGGANITFSYGNDTDIPIVGDWDGNGTVTAGVIRGTTWLLRNSNSAGSAQITVTYGTAGDKFVAGDWDGNGTFTPGIVRGNTWYLNNNFDGSHDITPFAFGASSDEPIVGNWDGTANATWTAGVILDGNNWLLKLTNTGGTADLEFVYGE